MSRLVKHTGYGNAAGLLARRGKHCKQFIFVKNLTIVTSSCPGLMAGGRGGGQGNYSSDEESDTEDYRNEDIYF